MSSGPVACEVGAPTERLAFSLPTDRRERAYLAAGDDDRAAQCPSTHPGRGRSPPRRGSTFDASSSRVALDGIVVQSMTGPHPGMFDPNDGTVDFYLRVRSVAPERPDVIDFGAGRGQWLDDPSDVRRGLRDIRDIAARIVGVDVDDAVLANPYVSEAVLIDGRGPVPLPDQSADLIIADFVLEHLDDPDWMRRESARLVRPGGWLCGRTPSRSGYIALASRIVPNSGHRTFISWLQPFRRSEDVFPTRYLINSMEQINGIFEAEFENHSFYFWANLDYGSHVWGFSRLERLWRLVSVEKMAPFIYVFLRRR